MAQLSEKELSFELVEVFGQSIFVGGGCHSLCHVCVLSKTDSLWPKQDTERSIISYASVFVCAICSPVAHQLPGPWAGCLIGVCQQAGC